MNLPEIRAFLALCEELHFGRTAERLNVPQSRVSRLIQSLEREVGGILFERTSRRVRLTPLGVRFRDEIKPAHAQLLAALGNARRAAHEANGTLSIGFTATTAGQALNRLINAFEHRHRDCEVTLHEVPMADPYTSLRKREVDVLLNWLAVDEPDLTAGPVIAYEPRVLLVAADHILARQDIIHMNDLAGYEVGRKPQSFPAALDIALHPAATPSGAPIPRTHPIKTVGEIATLVARGLIVHPTVASMAARLARDDTVLIPIADLPPLALGLIWCTAQENGRIRALAQVARSLPVN